MLLLISLVLLIAYWSAPKWVPDQVQSFLPAELKIKRLEIQRPGLSSAFVDALEIDIATDSAMTLKLENIQLHYSLLQKKLTTIDAEKAWLSIDGSSKESKKAFSNRIIIPKLPLDKLHLEQLQVSGLFIQDLIFSELELNHSDKQITLESKLNFIDLNFDLDAAVNIANTPVDTRTQAIANEVTLNLKQAEDFFSLKLSPKSNSTNGLNWQLDSSIDSQNYYHVEGLSKITLKGSGDFLSGENYAVTLNPDFQLSSPINLNELNLRPEIETLLKEKSLQLNLSQIDETLHFNIDTNQITQLEYSPVSYQLNLTQGSLPISIQQPLIDIQLNLEKLQLSPMESLSSAQQSVAGTLKFQSNLNQPSYSAKNVKAKTQTLAISFDSIFSIENSTLALSTENLSLDLAASSFSMNGIKTSTPNTQWSGSAKVQQNLIGEDKDNQQDIQLKQIKPIALILALTDEKISTQNLQNQVSFDGKQLTINSKAKTIQLQQNQLNLNQVIANTFINLSNRKLRGTVNFKDADYQNQNISAKNLSGNVAWSKSGNTIYSKGQLDHQNIKLPFQYRLQLDKQLHRLELDPNQFAVSPLIQWLDPILKGFPELSISGGEITNQKLSGNPLALTFDGSFSLKNLNLYYEELSLHNLQLEDKLSSRSALNGSVKASIDKIEIATGIDIKNINFQLQHNGQDIQLQNLSGQLLDGSIFIADLQLQKDKVEPFHVSLKAIDFGKLLKALESEALNIDGVFNFELPITVSKDSQTITDGTFSSTRAGILKVDSGASAATNIAFQAIENFHYTEFSGVINYDAAGIYRLKILLKGANPDLYDGFPIELSMNLEGNLPNLLYSMLISGDMAKPIIQKYQSGELEFPENP